MKKHLLHILLMLVSFSISVQAQNKLHFSVAQFAEDPFDTSARDKQYEKVDGNGRRFAIIKVSGDNLEQYQFDFGNMRHEAVMRHDVLWLYVQDKAQYVTITRNGYKAVNKYALTPAIEAGKNYVMELNAEATRIYAQIVQFHIKPIYANAVVMVRNVNTTDNSEMLGTVDAEGCLARSLPYGTYSYTVMAENYYTDEGRFTLNDKSTMHEETVTLRPKFGEVTFTVDADADIYVNNEKKGKRLWRGCLKAGEYQVECRQPNHRSTSQRITVTDNDTRTFTLNAPTPITGTIAVLSTPLGANISIDGQDYGTTPMNVDIVMGQHVVALSKENYQTVEQTVDVKEAQTTEVMATLNSKGRITITSQPDGAMLYIDGNQMGTTPYTTEMASGDYRLKLTKKKYNTFDKKVHLDVSQAEADFSLSRQYYKPYSGYLDLGFQVGMTMGPVATVGIYLKNVNIENFASYGLGDKTIYRFEKYYDSSCHIEEDEFWAPIIIGGKLGYGILVGNRMRITPQAGFGVAFVCHNAIARFRTSFISIGAKVEYAVNPHLSFFLSPQGRFAVYKSDKFKIASEKSSKIKAWGTGVDACVGLSVYL